MLKPRIFIGLTTMVVLLAAYPAFAAGVTDGVSDTVTAATITNTSGNCLAVNGYRRALTLDNTLGTAAIGYCRTSAAAPGTPCTAAIGTAGTTTLAAGSLHYWPAGAAPQNQICFIATNASQPLNIVEGQ